MTKLPEPPEFLLNVPFIEQSAPPAKWVDYGAPGVSSDLPPHPAYMPSEDLEPYYARKDYSSETVSPPPSQSILDPIWWSLGDAAYYIEGSLENEDPETSPMFSGLRRLEEVIRSERLQAYGSVDAAPVSAISAAAWTEFEMIPCNIQSDGNGSVTYEVLVRSARSYRAGALHDHGFPSGERVPSASAPGGEPGFHRIVSNAFVKESETRKLFVAKTVKPKPQRVGHKQKRLAGTLATMTMKGRKVYPDRGKLSFAVIAREVIKNWEKDDQRRDKIIEYDEGTEEQAVRRFYASATQTLSDK
jgi:hypothetical protein